MDVKDPFETREFVQGYDLFCRATGIYSRMMETLLDMTQVAGKRVADVGAGTGAGIDPIIRRNPSLVVALEPSPAMLRYLQMDYGKNPLVLIVEGQARDLAHSGKVDIALSGHVFPYLENPREALEGVMSAADEWVFSTVVEDPHTISGTDLFNGFMELAERLHEETYKTKIQLPRQKNVVHRVHKIYGSADDVVSLIRDGGFDVSDLRESYDVSKKADFLSQVYPFFSDTRDVRTYIDNLVEHVFARLRHPAHEEGVAVYQHHVLVKVKN